MSDSALQLQLERALKSFLAPAILVTRPVHAAHEVDTEPAGTYLVIMADPPDWEDMIINAIVPVRFEFRTDLTDPDRRQRTAQVVAHSDDKGAIIEAFSDQKFGETLTALDSAAPDSPLAFTGWEATKSAPDASEGNQVISRLSYDFVVYLKP